MPEARDALLASGAAFLAGMLYFYRKRQTVPFKVCYALAWPTLGGGTMLAVIPDEDEVRRRVLAGGAETAEGLEARRAANAAAVARLRGGGGEGSGANGQGKPQG